MQTTRVWCIFAMWTVILSLAARSSLNRKSKSHKVTVVATLHQRKDKEIHQGGGSPPPKKLFKEPAVFNETKDIDSVVSTPVEDRVRPSLGLTVTRISLDIREDFQIPLFERVFDALVTVEDSQVVRQSVEKLLKFLTDKNRIPPEYLTDERVLFWAKLKDEFRASGKYDDDF